MPRVGRSPWLNRIAELRQDDGAVQGPPGRVKGAALRAPDGAKAPEQRALIDAGVPAKVVAAHGAALHGAAEHVDRLSVAGHATDGWRKKAFDRIQGQVYKTLGLLLDRLPPGRRATAAKRAVSGLADLAHRVGPTDRLGPALNAAVGLVDGALRQSATNRLALSEDDAAKLFDAAVATVDDAVGRLEGRGGVGTSLNAFSTLADHFSPLGRAEGLAPLRARWAQSLSLLSDAAPQDGLTLDGAAHLTRALSDAVAAADGATEAEVVERATAAFQAPRAQARQDLLAHFAQPVKVPAGPSQEVHARLVDVLERVVEANPAGSEALFAAAQTFYDQATQRLRAAPQPYFAPLLDVVEALAGDPMAARVLEWAGLLVARNDATPKMSEALERAAQTEGGGRAAHMLTAVALADDPAADFGALEGDLAAAGPSALPAVMTFAEEPALLRTAGPGFVGTIVEEARTCGRDDLVGHLDRFAAHLSAISTRLTQINLQPPEARGEAAAALARLATHRGQLGQAPATLGTFLQQIAQQVPGADLAAASSRTLFDLADPEVHWRVPPANILPTLLAGLKRANLPNNDQLRTAAVDVAVQMTAEVAYLDGDHQVPFQRIQKDFEAAFAQPGQLTCLPDRSASPRKGARATVHDYLAAHPELPPELALTAGVHLKPAQMRWLAEQIDGTRGRDTIRQLRDAVFAAVDANRGDLIDALIGTETSPKAVRQLISVVARDYRERRLNQIPFDDLIAGLKAGEDPVSAMERKKVEAALGALKLEGEVTPEGAAELSRSAEAIRYLLEYTVPGKNVDGIDCKVFKEPFEQALNAVANGRWPEWKYEGEAADRALASLSDAQREVWTSETVSSVGGPAPADPAETAQAFAQARAAMKGVFKHLEQVRLPDIGGKKLGWDAESLERAEGQLGKLLEQVRGADKGSDAHRTASRRLGPVRQAVSLLRFHAATARLPVDARTALTELAPLLPDAARALRKAGFSAGQEAVQEALHLLETKAPSSPKSGVYAVDEDGLYASLTSTTGGCIVYNGVRRWATMNVALNPHEKILRVHDGDDGDDFKYRACLKLFDAKFPGYDGPVLWMNYPNRHGGGNQEHLEVLLEGAKAKADALGVPLVSAWNLGGHGFLKAQRKQVTVLVDDGRTGSTYVDYQFRASNIQQARGQQPRYQQALDLYVSMP